MESDFDPYAVSNKDCKGLMQLHPKTASYYGVEDVFDPAENIEGGVRYLRDLRGRYEDIELILAAYNAGETAVARYNGIPPYRETQNYVRKVLSIYEPSVESAPRPGRNAARIYRVVLPDGSILLTNTPTDQVNRSIHRSSSPGMSSAGSR